MKKISNFKNPFSDNNPSLLSQQLAYIIGEGNNPLIHLDHDEFISKLPLILNTYSQCVRRRNIKLLKFLNIFKDSDLEKIEDYIFKNIDENCIQHKDIIEKFYFEYISNKNELLNSLKKSKYRSYYTLMTAIHIQSESILIDHLDSTLKTKIVSNFLKCHRDFSIFFNDSILNPVFEKLFLHFTDEQLDSFKYRFITNEHYSIDQSIKKIKDYIYAKNNLENF